MWPGPAAEVAEDPGKEEGWRQRWEAERKQTPCSVKSFSTCFFVFFYDNGKNGCWLFSHLGSAGESSEEGIQTEAPEKNDDDL